MSGHIDRKEVPGEILEHICSFISTDLPTLAILLRVSKLLCRIVAPLVYHNLVVTPDVDILVDTGLSASLLDGERESEGDKGDVEREVEESSTVRAGDGTLKRKFLDLIKKLDIYPSRPVARIAEDNCANEPVVIDPIPPIPPPQPVSPPTQDSSSSMDRSLHLSCQLRLRLDTSTHHRLSPYDNANPLYHSDNYPSALRHILRPHRFIIHGAGFHQSSFPLIHLPISLFNHLREVIVIITRGAAPAAGDMLSMNHGLPFIFNSLITALMSDPADGDDPRTDSVDITFVLQTSSPVARFPPMDPPPQGGMPMTMDYHPDYAPGYLHPMTTLLGQRLVVLRSASSEHGVMHRGIGMVRFVNLGALDGEQVGMPQAAMGEMQDRFEKGVRVRLSRAGIEEEDQGVEVMGMQEWLENSKSGEEEVLDEHILEGWRIRHQDFR